MFQVTCPCCQETNATIRVDVTDGQTMFCSDCDTEFSLEHIENVLSSWAKIMPWLNAHPNNQAK